MANSDGVGRVEDPSTQDVGLREVYRGEDLNVVISQGQDMK